MWSETNLAIVTSWRRARTGAMPARLFDAIPLRSLREGTVGLRPWPVRATLRGLIYAPLDAAMAIREAA